MHGLIEQEYYGKVYLTEEGKQLGESLVTQHEILKQFLRHLGIKEANLVKELDEIEFTISRCVIQRMEW